MQLNKPEDLCSQNSYNLFQFPFVSFQMITCNTNNTDAPYFTTEHCNIAMVSAAFQLASLVPMVFA